MRADIKSGEGSKLSRVKCDSKLTWVPNLKTLK